MTVVIIRCDRTIPGADEVVVVGEKVSNVFRLDNVDEVQVRPPTENKSEVQ